MANLALLIWKRSTRNIFGWAKQLSFLNMLHAIFVTIICLLWNVQPYRFESLTRFPIGALPINWKQYNQRHCPKLHEEGSFVPYYLKPTLFSLIYLLEGSSFPIALLVLYLEWPPRTPICICGSCSLARSVESIFICATCSECLIPNPLPPLM